MQFFKYTQYSKYTPLRRHVPGDLDDDERAQSQTRNSSAEAVCLNCIKPRRISYCLTFLNLVVLSISLALAIAWVRDEYGKNAILKKSSYYCINPSLHPKTILTVEAPIFDRLTISTLVKETNGTLFTTESPSIGRAFPNPEADAIWEEIELARTISITAEDVRKLGKDPEIAATFDNEYWGMGDDAYMGQIDVFHQLHCLNSLRKLAYPKSYAPDEKCDQHDEMWYIHINHCVDILLQNLMCSSNVDIITLNWMETQKYPFPDFSINHQCRDFDTLLQWRKENSVDMKMWNEMVKPEGVKQVPAPERYYELFENGKIGREGGNLVHEHGHHSERA